jgi:stress response protein YsnF
MRRPDEMVCWREEVEFAATERVIGSVKVHTYVTEEKVSRQIPLEHEEVRVIREKIGDSEAMNLRAHDFHEQFAEVELRAQEALVSKKMVPVERIRFEVQRVKDMVTVNEVLRQEHFKVEEPPKLPEGNRVRRVTDTGAAGMTEMRSDVRPDMR